MMRPLAGSDLLWVWEWGARRHPVDRAMLILSATWPEQTTGDLASLTIGQRDAYLLETRAATFGDKLDSHAVCPACQGEFQFSLKATELRDVSQPDDAQAPFALELDGFRLQLKCLNSRDLADAARMRDPEAARRLLLERCVVEASRDDRSIPIDDLPAPVMDAVAAWIAEHDPQADIQLDLVCPDCGHEWQLVFDIASYLWEEIANRAPQLLYEVHTLARAYGWTESDILAMSPVRREAYLQMVG